MSVNRGFWGIGIYCPVHAVNVGTLLRHAHGLGASFTFTVGGKADTIRQASNTTKSYRHIPHHHFRTADEMWSGLPVGCPLIAIEIVPGAIDLTLYDHREQAAYLLGPENGSLPREIIERAVDVVSIPGSDYCFNVATAGTLVAWHRVALGGVPLGDGTMEPCP